MGNKYFSAEQFQNDIALEIEPSQMNQIITIADNNQAAFFSEYDLTGCKGHINAQLVELQLFTVINVSIPEVPPPMLSREDGEYANVLRTNDYLWKTSRLELELYTRSRTGKWVMRGIVPIKHNAGFRFRRSRLIDLFTDNVQSEFGRGGAIGCRLVNVGFGNLMRPDLVNIAGSWIQEPIIVQEHHPLVNNTANYYSSTIASPSPSPSPTPSNEVVNQFELNFVSQTILLEPRATRTSLSITVLTPGFSGGFVNPTDSTTGNLITTLNPNRITWTSQETGKVINDFTTWKGQVRGNQGGFGDPEDRVYLRITEKYTT